MNNGTKNRSKNLKVAFAACLAAAVIITLVSATCVPVAEAAVYDNVVRLHVIANSDSQADQALKYAVRDAILAQAAEVFAGREITEAIGLVSSSLPRIEEIAQGVIDENGAPYAARAVFGDEEYPTREYDGVVYPAGKYRSLRVILGEGDGENWWCVLFPPLCLGSSGGDGETDGTSYAGKTANRRCFRFRIKLLELFGFN